MPDGLADDNEVHSHQEANKGSARSRLCASHQSETGGNADGATVEPPKRSNVCGWKGVGHLRCGRSGQLATGGTKRARLPPIPLVVFWRSGREGFWPSQRRFHDPADLAGSKRRRAVIRCAGFKRIQPFRSFRRHRDDDKGQRRTFPSYSP